MYILSAMIVLCSRWTPTSCLSVCLSVSDLCIINLIYMLCEVLGRESVCMNYVFHYGNHMTYHGHNLDISWLSHDITWCLMIVTWLHMISNECHMTSSWWSHDTVYYQIIGCKDGSGIKNCTQTWMYNRHPSEYFIRTVTWKWCRT